MPRRTLSSVAKVPSRPLAPPTQGEYVLPELPYDYGALEPYLSARSLELHHAKHHGACVKAANQALERLDEARQRGDFIRAAALERTLAFHLCGHLLHSTLWQNLAPGGEPSPSGALAAAIGDAFGSTDGLRRELGACLDDLVGTGWAVLVWEPLARRLLVAPVLELGASLGQLPTPLLVVDGWEHAHYLQYQNRRAEYLEAIWKIVNWTDVADRFARAPAGQS